jgi:hypothetical protein
MSSKKRIDTSTIVNELRGASLFFRKEEPSETQELKDASPLSSAGAESPIQKVQPKDESSSATTDDTTIPRHHDTVIPRHHDTTKVDVASSIKRDLYDEELLGKVVAQVKLVGTVAATYRFTQEEKSRLGMAVFNLLSGGVRVSENELVRIALNFLLDCLEEGISKYDDNPYAKVVKRVKQTKR